MSYITGLSHHELLGCQAHDQGQPLSANPWQDQPTTANARQWREGWMIAAGQAVAVQIIRERMQTRYENASRILRTPIKKRTR